MISGRVNEFREPIVRITLRGSGATEVECPAIVDTGFDGWLTLPPEKIDQLGLVWKRMARAVLADGSEKLFDVFEGSIVWHGVIRTIPIDASPSEPLIGMHLLDGDELTILASIGGSVTIKRV